MRALGLLLVGVEKKKVKIKKKTGPDVVGRRFGKNGGGRTKKRKMNQNKQQTNE